MVASGILVGLASLARALSPAAMVAAVTLTILEGFLLTGLIRAIDGKSIASVRRLLGLMFVSNLIWIIPLAIGLGVSAFTPLHGGTNEFIFGAFLVWGFETVVINGAFVRNTAVSLLIAAIHPISVLLIVLSAGGFSYLYPAATGVVALVFVLFFLLKLENLKTKHGIPAPQILQAFLKTWVSQEPADLESYFSKYSKSESVVTDIILGQTKEKRVAFVLPGVHPGPFFPVGSYNLSELIYRALKDDRTSPVVLHGTGGHERNTPNNTIASSYVAEISSFVRSMGSPERGRMRGPVHDKIGTTNIVMLAFGNETLSIISNSPYLSEDLDPMTVSDAASVASKLGLRLSIVDAHNSVDGESRRQTQISKSDWESIIAKLMALPEREFSLGFASSSGKDLKLGYDVSEGGINVAVFVMGDTKNVLVAADSNNAVSGLRERISDELAKKGMGFVELCTSDTHNFAARNLTSRGYFALGEGSGVEHVIDVIMTLTAEAEGNVAPCDLTVTRVESEIPLIGTESLDDFAGLTKNAISVSKAYVKLLAPAVLLLTVITLFY